MHLVIFRVILAHDIMHASCTLLISGMNGIHDERYYAWHPSHTIFGSHIHDIQYSCLLSMILDFCVCYPCAYLCLVSRISNK